MAHHTDGLPDVFDVSRVVPSNRIRLLEDTTSNHSNGSDTKTHDSSQSTLGVVLEFGEEEPNHFRQLGIRN